MLSRHLSSQDPTQHLRACLGGRLLGGTPVFECSRQGRKRTEMPFAHFNRILRTPWLRSQCGAHDESPFASTTQNLRMLDEPARPEVLQVTPVVYGKWWLAGCTLGCSPSKVDPIIPSFFIKLGGQGRPWRAGLPLSGERSLATLLFNLVARVLARPARPVRPRRKCPYFSKP